MLESDLGFMSLIESWIICLMDPPGPTLYFWASNRTFGWWQGRKDILPMGSLGLAPAGILYVTHGLARP